MQQRKVVTFPSSLAFCAHNEAVVVPAAEELAAIAGIQPEETLVLNCNNTAGLGRLIVPLTRERLKLSGEIEQPGGRKIQYCYPEMHPFLQIFIL